MKTKDFYCSETWACNNIPVERKISVNSGKIKAISTIKIRLSRDIKYVKVLKWVHCVVRMLHNGFAFSPLRKRCPKSKSHSSSLRFFYMTVCYNRARLNILLYNARSTIIYNTSCHLAWQGTIIIHIGFVTFLEQTEKSKTVVIKELSNIQHRAMTQVMEWACITSNLTDSRLHHVSIID